jgi:hypothetical protein
MEYLKLSEDFRHRVINEINQVRTNPQKYAEKIRKYKAYFKGKILKVPEIIPIMTTEGPSAFEEAARFLDNLDAMEPLKYSAGLTHVAHDALKDIQKFDDIDQLSDLGLDTYINNHGQILGHLAQAVDFGSSIPELVVINLLVDDGDLNRGNRDNIINPKYKLVGVSTGNHPVYHNCTVVIYCRHFYEKDQDPGELSDENYEDEKTTPINDAKEQKINVVRRTSLDKKYIFVDEPIEKVVTAPAKQEDDDFCLPEGVMKLERQEKLVNENGVNKKIVKVIKHMEDGTVKTEIFKEKI